MRGKVLLVEHITPHFFRLKPDVLWAQRNDTVLLTISLSDIRNEKTSLEENMFSFAGNAGPEGKFYAVQMTFHKEVVPQVEHKVYWATSMLRLSEHLLTESC